MFVLEYLRKAESKIRVDEDSTVRFDNILDEKSLRVEYRLICSGAFYPNHILSEWSKSDSARILLHSPFELLVASRPYDDYPQELALRFFVGEINETEGSFSTFGFPDKEIAADLAALLTLLCRRLVTVSVKLREQYHSKACSADSGRLPDTSSTKNQIGVLASATNQFNHN
jgi:hypothetical protein